MGCWARSTVSISVTFSDFITLFFNVSLILTRLCKSLFPVISPSRTLYWTEFLRFFFHLFHVAYLNRFEKVAVPNEHYMCAARDHDPFYRSKNRTVRPSFFSLNIITYFLLLDLRNNHIKQSLCMSKLQNWRLKGLFIGAYTNLTTMCCSGSLRFLRHFSR